MLAQICNLKRADTARRKQELPLAALEAKIADLPPPRGFVAALEAKLADGRLGLIAEIKKASPSKGMIRENFDPPALAQAYQAGGATCLSILTEEPHFLGSDAFLRQARAATALPCLRKDFMLDPYQIVEARAIGADCVLLIIAALDDRDARHLANLANDLGLDVLVEVHNEAELDRALDLNTRLIGVNNRNLATLHVDLKVTEDLAPNIPADRLLVAESGLHSHDDLQRMVEAGARCFLVGESLMRQADVEAATRSLLGLDPPGSMSAACDNPDRLA